MGGGGGGGERGRLLKKKTSFNKLSKVGSAGDDVPKGCFAVKVGEEQERFVVPLVYINHPLFLQLLKEAEDEYGFDQKGPISIPCHVDQFRHVQGIIHSTHHHPHHHNHRALVGCFRA